MHVHVHTGEEGKGDRALSLLVILSGSQLKGSQGIRCRRKYLIDFLLLVEGVAFHFSSLLYWNVLTEVGGAWGSRRSSFRACLVDKVAETRSNG